MRGYIKKLLRENLNDFLIVYRGQGEYENLSPSNSIWVSRDYNFAKEYGKVMVFKLPKALNILDSEINYSIWENLIDEYEILTGGGGDYDEYKYEPNEDFINFLTSKGYHGFENGDNILIFNKQNLTTDSTVT
jgi:hypothetical protein